MTDLFPKENSPDSQKTVEKYVISSGGRRPKSRNLLNSCQSKISPFTSLSRNDKDEMLRSVEMTETEYFAPEEYFRTEVKYFAPPG